MNKVKPFLGKLKIRVIKESTKARLDKKVQAETGASKEFLQAFKMVYGESVEDPNTGRKEFRAYKENTIINKGIVLEMAPDCFGKAFQDRYGSEREYPEVGDIIIFIPNKSYQIDPENEYHLVDECDIVGYLKAEDYADE